MGAKNDNMLKGIELARAMLSAKDRYALLSLGSDTPLVVGRDGFLNLEDEAVRRIYMKLAAQVHPDKLAEASAKDAFQALVRAYELVCKPDLRADDSDDSRDDDEGSSDEEGSDEVGSAEEGSAEEDSSDDDYSTGGRVVQAVQSRPVSTATTKPKPAAKPAAKPRPAAKPAKRKGGGASSSGGSAAAVRTCVTCPRCFAEWGDHLKGEGNEAAFTEFMQGRRLVHCLVCLFEFGCLTAGHGCASCKRAFEYRPERFGREHVCTDAKERGKKKCGVRFRIAQFSRSRAKQEEEEARLKSEGAARRKREDAADARRARSASSYRHEYVGEVGEVGEVHVSGSLRSGLTAAGAFAQGGRRRGVARGAWLIHREPGPRC